MLFHLSALFCCRTSDGLLVFTKIPPFPTRNPSEYLEASSGFPSEHRSSMRNGTASPPALEKRPLAAGRSLFHTWRGNKCIFRVVVSQSMPSLQDSRGQHTAAIPKIPFRARSSPGAEEHSLMSFLLHGHCLMQSSQNSFSERPHTW